jgi:hypothetical protein
MIAAREGRREINMETCFICGNELHAGSSRGDQVKIELGYVGGNGKRRSYCMTCVISCIHIATTPSILRSGEEFILYTAPVVKP